MGAQKQSEVDALQEMQGNGPMWLVHQGSRDSEDVRVGCCSEISDRPQLRHVQSDSLWVPLVRV